MLEDPESVEPIITLTALSGDSPPTVLAKIGPIRGFDLGSVIRQVMTRMHADNRPRSRGYRFECVVDLVDVPYLYLDPPEVAELAAAEASLEIKLRERISSSGEDASVVADPEIDVHFEVVGDGFSASELTARTGIAPDLTRPADKSTDDRGRRRTRPEVWALKSGVHWGEDFTPLLEAMLLRLRPKHREIRAFCAEHPGARAEVCFVAEFARPAPQLVLEAQHFTSIRDLGAGVWYDLYKRDHLD